MGPGRGRGRPTNEEETVSKRRLRSALVAHRDPRWRRCCSPPAVRGGGGGSESGSSESSGPVEIEFWHGQTQQTAKEARRR